ncbi:MAG: hypothetical protein K2M20_08305 [Lachnospiraceae bacterium]|nr:hypothetical protein [Lachnospiraceae bacterium]
MEEQGGRGNETVIRRGMLLQKQMPAGEGREDAAGKRTTGDAQRGERRSMEDNAWDLIGI